jgi:nitric oxide synthase-interacting protein
MTRHSQHANDRTYYSHQERKDAGYAASEKEVLGSDCFLPFGLCAISLKASKDPVATPQGIIFDREAILECLLHQKVTLSAEKDKYDAQEQAKVRALAAEKRKEELREIEEFTNAETAVLAEDPRHKRKAEVLIHSKDRENPNDIYSHNWSSALPTKKRREGELMVIDKHEMAQSSFWARNATKTAAPSELKKVVVQTTCPVTGKKLRVKDLIPIKLEVIDQKKFEQGGEKGCFCCAISKHAIVHQKAVVIKPSGVVVLESMLKDCVLKDMRCPISGKAIKGMEDILKLKSGETGFSAHNEITAKHFNSIRSRASDDRRAQGHLPKAGYVGLR